MRRLLGVGVLILAMAGAWFIILERRGESIGSLFSGPSFLSTKSASPAKGQATSSPSAASTARGGSALPVEVAHVRKGESVADILTVGSLQSDESVQISSEIAGRIADISFSEGEHVKAGDILVRLDSVLTQAEVDDVRARFELAEANQQRTSVLAKAGNATQRANDEATATLASARAALALVEARFNKLSIRAPFSGVLGVRKVSVGAYLNPGVAIVNLEKIDDLKVDFKVPEIYLSRVKVGQTVDVTVDALPGRSFTGTIYAIDPMVDVNGRALNIRARLPNPDLVLRPGLFARIAIKGAGEEMSLFVPEEAIMPRGGKTFVYQIIDGKAQEVAVQLGTRKAGEVEILQGLKEDAVIVTAGQQRLRGGAPVEIISIGQI